MEVVKINVIGIDNVLNVVIVCGVKKVICLLIDKVVYLINVMGLLKVLMEKIVIVKLRMVLFEKIILCCI